VGCDDDDDDDDDALLLQLIVTAARFACLSGYLHAAAASVIQRRICRRPLTFVITTHARLYLMFSLCMSRS